MARKKTSWSPSTVPAMKDALARAWTLSARQREQSLAGLFDAYHPRGPEKSKVTTWKALASLADSAEMYWVTDAMARIALDASQDIPGSDFADMPAPIGLIVLEKPLPPVRLPSPMRLHDRRTGDLLPERFSDPVPLDAILWSAGRDSIRLILCTRSTRLPGRVLVGSPPLEPVIDMGFKSPLDFEKIDDKDSVADKIGISAWIATAWHLMTIPTTASVTPATVAKPKKPGVSKNTQEPGQVRDVKIVDLRPLRHHSEETAKAGDRNTPGHRWVVRGHWRNQPYGKKRAKRRVQWVESYIKGPDGAPLVERAIVNVWRR